MALTLRMPRPSLQYRHLPTKTIASPVVSSVLLRSVYWIKPLWRSPIQNTTTRFVSFQCEEVLNVNNSSSSKISQTNWERIHAMQDEDIDFSDIPEATEEQIAQAVLRVGGVPVERGKQQVNMMLDAFIVEYFKRKAGEQDYQTLINAALSDYIRHNPFPTQST